MRSVQIECAGDYFLASAPVCDALPALAFFYSIIAAYSNVCRLSSVKLAFSASLDIYIMKAMFFVFMSFAFCLGSRVVVFRVLGELGQDHASRGYGGRMDGPVPVTAEGASTRALDFAGVVPGICCTAVGCASFAFVTMHTRHTVCYVC